MSPEAEALAKQIEAMAPQAQLRLAADLLDRREFTLARALIRRISVEMGVIAALGPSTLKERGFW